MPPPDHSATEAGQLRQSLRDLALFAAMPARWTDARSEDIAARLADSLLQTLNLDLVALRVPGLATPDFIDAIRVRPSLNDVDSAALRPLIEPLLDGTESHPGSLLLQAYHPPLPVLVIPLGSCDDEGRLVAASRRAGFPSEDDRLVLRTAAGQAAVCFQTSREAYRAVERSERLRTTLASIGDAVITTDINGRITNLNPVAESLTGWTNRDAVGVPLAEVFRIINEQTRRPVENPADRALRDGVIVGLANHTLLIARDGTERPIDDSAAPIRCIEGEVVGCVLVFRDVTERRDTERKLQQSEERYRALVTAAAQIVWTTDPQGRVVDDSPSWRDFTGQTREQWEGFGWLDAIHPDDRDRTSAAWSRSVSTRTPCEMDYRVRRHDGEYRWTSVRAVPVLDETGDIREWVGTNADVHDRMLAQIEEAERSHLVKLRADVNSALVTAQPVQTGLHECCEALVQHLGAAFARIWTTSQSGDELLLQASAGLYTHLDGPHSRIRIGEFKIGRIARNRRPHLTNDVLNDPNISDPEWARREGMHAFAGYPLIVDDRMVGVMALFSQRLLSEAVLSDLAPLAESIAQYIDRRRNEAALRESELRYRLVGQAANDAIWDWNLVTNEVTWNEGLQSRFGYTTDQIGRHADWWVDHIHPEDRERVAHSIHAVIDGTDEVWHDEYRYRRADGSYAEVFDRGRVVREHGKPVRMVGSMLDLTERKHAERMANFLADASAAIADLTDYESTLQKVAHLAVPTFADWCAIDMLDEHGGRNRIALMHRDDDKIRLALELDERYPVRMDDPHGVGYVLSTGESELVPDIPDSTLAEIAHDERHLELLRELKLTSYICTPIRSHGRMRGCVTFVSDSASRRFNQSDLRVAQDLCHRVAVAIENATLYRTLQDANRRKTEFLATLGHELRNPLAPIRTGLELLRLMGHDPVAFEETRSTMERQTQQLITLVDDLLDVSRITLGKLELRKRRVVLADVVRSAVEASRPFIDDAGHSLKVVMPDDGIQLIADPHRLAQVLSNLLNNAAKYTPEGGRIRLTTDCRDGEVAVSVSDNGLGIPADQLEQIFEMFAQIDRPIEKGYTGLGIGLTLVKSLVTMHDGAIEVRSDGHNQGSTFTIRLPVLDDCHSDPLSDQDGGHASSAAPKRRVLVVDDNKDGAAMLSMVVKMLGNDVRTAHDGQEAIEVAQDFRPDVIIMDLGMPRMNGYEAARHLRDQPWGRGITLVALTGWGQEEDKQRTRAAGFDHHLTKPADPSELKRLFASTPRHAQ